MISSQLLDSLMMKVQREMEREVVLTMGQVIIFKKLSILDSFRRFVKDIGVIENCEYQIDISKGLPQISDYGNIQIPTEPGYPVPSLQGLHEKLSTKVGLCIQRGNIPFIIGGSRDLFGAVSDALLNQQDKKSGFISINHALDVKLLLDQGVPHESSNKRYLLEKMKSDQDCLIEFGMNGQNVTKEDLEYFQSKNPLGKIFWMSEIRKNQISKQEGVTQAGKIFQQLIKEMNQYDQVYLSINMENIEGAPGVTSNCTSGGFTTEEAIEICYLAGSQMTNLVAIDITEYNPFVEDWRTGRLVSTMFYYFVLGLSQRLQNLNK